MTHDSNTLEWAAQWVEGSLVGETNERVIEFGKNMAMTFRAACQVPASDPAATGEGEGETCQWSYTQERTSGHFNTSCNKVMTTNRSFGVLYEFCPFCGKRIVPMSDNPTATTEASALPEHPDCVCEFDVSLGRVIFCEFHLGHNNLVHVVNHLSGLASTGIARLEELLKATVHDAEAARLREALRLAGKEKTVINTSIKRQCWCHTDAYCFSEVQCAAARTALNPTGEGEE